MSKIKLTLGNGRAIMPSAANEKAVKNVLARRLKLTPPESVRVISDATGANARRRLKFPMHRWEEFKIGCFAPGKSASCEVKAAVWSIILSWGGWKSPVTSLNG